MIRPGDIVTSKTSGHVGLAKLNDGNYFHLYSMSMQVRFSSSALDPSGYLQTGRMYWDTFAIVVAMNGQYDDVMIVNNRGELGWITVLNLEKL